MTDTSANPPRFPSWPSFTTAEIEAVAGILASGRVNYWTGSEGQRFEREYAGYVGVNHAIALANGSVALELALRALGIGPGDEVIVTPRSFIASASSVVLAGAVPVFADVDRDSGNITADSVALKITDKTKAIIAVHLAGWPCDMRAIQTIAQRHELKVIEDCAQAHGARHDGVPVGAFGDAAAFSFCQDKIMTTGGEGGMLLVRDNDVWEKARSYKDHGKNHAALSSDRTATRGAFRWVHDGFGSNFRMTEMQAAIGRIQLASLDDWVAKRRDNARVLYESLSRLAALRIPLPDDHSYHAYYKFYAFVRPDRLAPDWSRDRVIDEIRARGVPCFGGSCSEIYREKAFVDSPFHPPQPLPTASALGQTSLMLLVHPTLNKAAMRGMASIVHDVVSSAQA